MHSQPRSREERAAAMAVLRDREAQLARIARCQHGLATRAQLIEIGFSVDSIDNRVRSGRFHVLHRGVYLVQLVETNLTREMAAVLAYGTRTLLSNIPAAKLWSLPLASRSWSQPVVTVVGRYAAPRRGITVHRVRSMMRDETKTRNHIPVTSPARTILDTRSFSSATPADREPLRSAHCWPKTGVPPSRAARPSAAFWS